MGHGLLRHYIREVLDGFGNKNLGKDGVAGNLRYDVPVRAGAGGNILTDEENEEQAATQSGKRAATVLVIADDGKVLAVSRRDDPTMWGLPGGKVDAGEEIADAAVRELKEETGLDASDLSAVFSRVDSEDYETTTFVGKVSGQINTTEEGLVRWVDKDVLTNPDTSPFVSYNVALFRKLGL